MGARSRVDLPLEEIATFDQCEVRDSRPEASICERL